MNKYLLVVVILLFFAGYGNGQTNQESNESAEEPTSMIAKEEMAEPMNNKGIGPITSVILDKEIDMGMARLGEVIYQQMCITCHKPDKDFIGPAPKGILGRRSAEWIMNMILNPEEMILKDSIAAALLIQYNGAPMADQNLSEEQARQVLEYFRTL